MSIYRCVAVIGKDDDGYYAYCPELQGCCTSGDTFEEVCENPADAIRLHVEDRLADGEELKPARDNWSLTGVEVAGERYELMR